MNAGQQKHSWELSSFLSSRGGYFLGLFFFFCFCFVLFCFVFFSVLWRDCQIQINTLLLDQDTQEQRLIKSLSGVGDTRADSPLGEGSMLGKVLHPRKPVN